LTGAAIDLPRLAAELRRAVRLGYLHPAIAWLVLIDASRKAPR
jgi:hypothetical protein